MRQKDQKVYVFELWISPYLFILKEGEKQCFEFNIENEMILGMDCYLSNL